MINLISSAQESNQHKHWSNGPHAGPAEDSDSSDWNGERAAALPPAQSCWTKLKHVSPLTSSTARKGWELETSPPGGGGAPWKSLPAFPAPEDTVRAGGSRSARADPLQGSAPSRAMLQSPSHACWGPPQSRPTDCPSASAPTSANPSVRPAWQRAVGPSRPSVPAFPKPCQTLPLLGPR